ncbi:MAG: sulfurtransferase [Armatimonadota bacterium]|nr:sulfurtransferase [Armatimonadota bacterium]MDR7438459.1 sulfurtransferase [Armatimonadota bacterium]MDR7563156.1 sulfurtransferase [Armatimonadota bacterium]MDR7567147.1 sulfurtransferase [Armatimonadota bacterium]MDR7602299.1 sulfurtransferase [Armatimonadota bacterium]
MARYAHPEVLVETEWLHERLGDPALRIVESNEDPDLYAQGHIPGAIHLRWKTDLQDPVRRDWVSREQLEELLGERGIGNEHTIVLYGDRNNWFATYTFWLLRYYGVENVKILNGGRQKWIAEGRPLTTEVPQYPPTPFRAKDPDPALRAFRDEILQRLQDPALALVDVRSPQEYHGELIAPPGYPQEGAQRPGHIPRAVNIPWTHNVREDGTFKSAEELRATYEPLGIAPNKEVIAYCRIGERSSLTWFVLKYLLGYPKVKNYDGSWTEWGSLVGVPIERTTPVEAKE